MISGLALTIAAVALPTAAPEISWHNVTLGAPALSLRAVLGDPLRIVPVNGERVGRYWLPGADSTYLLVIEGRGRVHSFEAFTNTAPEGVLQNVLPDPSGVRLGDTMDSVKAKHPEFRESVDEDGNPILIVRISPTAVVGYVFRNNRVSSFHWSAPLSDSQADLPPLALPAGDSFATAILDMQENEDAGVAWEYRFLAFHPCAENTRWQLKNQALTKNGGRAYDLLHVVCPATKAERDFYFDITSFYGKL